MSIELVVLGDLLFCSSLEVIIRLEQSLSGPAKGSLQRDKTVKRKFAPW